jgi:hypothetical protein
MVLTINVITIIDFDPVIGHNVVSVIMLDMSTVTCIAVWTE